MRRAGDSRLRIKSTALARATQLLKVSRPASESTLVLDLDGFYLPNAVEIAPDTEVESVVRDNQP